jgi:heme exporter protein D
MDHVQEFFAMGGYAAYVWTAWGLTLFVLGGLAWASLRSMRARERELAALESAREGQS